MKRFLIVVLIIGVLIISALFVLGHYWKPIVKNALTKAVYESTEGLYRVEFDDLSINLLTGNLRIKDARIIADQELYDQLSDTVIKPPYLFTIHVKEILLRNVHPIKLYLENKLTIAEIRINQPEIDVRIQPQKKADTTASDKFRNPYELIKDMLKALVIEQINLKDIKLNFINVRNKSSQKLYISDLRVRGLKIDSLAQFDKERPFYTDDIRISVKNFSFPMRDSLYIMKFDEAIASTANSNIQFYNFRYIPRLSEKRFKDRNGFRKSRFDLYVRQAILSKFDFKKIFYDQQVFAKSFEVLDMEAKVHTNKLMPDNLAKPKRFPVELLNDISIPFFIDETHIRKSRLTYSELDAKTLYQWKINFGNMECDIYNLTNDSLAKLSNKFATAKLRALFQDQAKVNVDFAFDLNAPNYPFICKGVISEYKLEGLNDLIVPLSKIEIANCNLRRLDFHLNGDKTKVKTQVAMRYNNLRIRIMEMDEEEKVLKRNRLFSLLANLVVLSNDNPSVNGKFVKPTYVYTRLERQGYFAYIWKALFKGIKESVGLNSQMEAEIRNRVEQARHFKEQKKERQSERKLKKEDRQGKKEQRILLRQLKRAEKGGTDTLQGKLHTNRTN